MPYLDYRPRLSIVLDEKDFNDLNELLGDWRIKNRLYVQITRDLIRVLKALNPEQRKMFLVAILEGDLKVEEYNSTVRKVKEGE